MKKQSLWISVSLLALFAVIMLVYAATHSRQSPPFMVDTRTVSQRALTHRASSQPFRLDLRNGIYASHSASSVPFAIDLRQPDRNYGDVSGNGIITAFDASMILQHVVDLIGLSDEAKILADVSNDGEITAFDASLVLQHVVGLLIEFPIETGTAASPQLANLAYRVKLSNSELCAKSGESVTIPLIIDGEQIYGGEFAIAFDKNIFASASITPNIPGHTIKQKIEVNKRDAYSTIKFSFAGIEPIESSQIAELQFVVSDDANAGETAIRFEVAKINETKKISVSNATIEILPSKTALLNNYPNPFNPETWIPFRLANDADVTIKLFDLTGRLVRSIEVGHRTAGSYVAKEKAVHWDGRNNLGERVASGVYFYYLKADNFEATRKMLILK